MLDPTELPPVLQAFGEQLAGAMRAAQAAAPPAAAGAARTRARRRAARLAGRALRVPRRWVALAVTTALATGATIALVATLLLSAGAATPAPAQAFPILAGRASKLSAVQLRASLRGLTVLLAAQELGLASPRCRHARANCDDRQQATMMVRSWLRGLLDGDQHAADAHRFAVSGGTGYVIESPDGRVLCLQYLTSAARWSLAGACSATGQAERQGLVLAPESLITPESARRAGPHASLARSPSFIALVPVGGTVSLTEDGATRRQATHDGIATGLVDVAATLSLQVAGSTLSVRLAPPAAPSAIGGVPATPAVSPPRGVSEFAVTPGTPGGVAVWQGQAP